MTCINVLWYPVDAFVLLTKQAAVYVTLWILGMTYGLKLSVLVLVLATNVLITSLIIAYRYNATFGYYRHA